MMHDRRHTGASRAAIVAGSTTGLLLMALAWASHFIEGPPVLITAERVAPLSRTEGKAVCAVTADIQNPNAAALRVHVLWEAFDAAGRSLGFVSLRLPRLPSHGRLTVVSTPLAALCSSVRRVDRREVVTEPAR
jgi:hypothetical protein